MATWYIAAAACSELTAMKAVDCGITARNI